MPGQTCLWNYEASSMNSGRLRFGLNVQRAVSYCSITCSTSISPWGVLGQTFFFSLVWGPIWWVESRSQYASLLSAIYNCELLHWDQTGGFLTDFNLGGFYWVWGVRRSHFLLCLRCQGLKINVNMTHGSYKSFSFLTSFFMIIF